MCTVQSQTRHVVQPFLFSEMSLCVLTSRATVVCSSIGWNICLPAHPSFHPSDHFFFSSLPICLPVYLSVSPPHCLPIHLSTCLSVQSLLICLFILALSVCFVNSFLCVPQLAILSLFSSSVYASVCLTMSLRYVVWNILCMMWIKVFKCELKFKISLIENRSAVSRGYGSSAQDVSNRGGRTQEDKHGSPVCGGIARCQRSRSHPLWNRQNHCVSEK